MKILMIANYYYPYISGITVTTKKIAEKLAEHNEVTVLCSNHNQRKLPNEEIINNVKVIRAPIIMKISKGTVSPKFISLACKLSKESDVVNMHLPMLESGLISSLIESEKNILTYHCDINLPPSLINNFIVKTMDFSHNIALKKANKIIVETKDYAKSSRIAKKYINKEIEILPIFREFSKTNVKRNNKVIGFCGRIVEEKGIDVLIRAFKIIKDKYPQYSLEIAGDYLGVAGGSVINELKKIIEEENIKDVKFLGKLSDQELNDFYSKIGVFVLPSINSLEALGLVQFEAMQCSCPVVASDLPGVRQIVKRTKMGEIAKVNSPEDLAKKIIKVLNNRQKYIKTKKELENFCTNERIYEEYQKVFEEIKRNNNKK